MIQEKGCIVPRFLLWIFILGASSTAIMGAEPPTKPVLSGSASLVSYDRPEPERILWLEYYGHVWPVVKYLASGDPIVPQLKPPVRLSIEWLLHSLEVRRLVGGSSLVWVDDFAGRSLLLFVRFVYDKQGAARYMMRLQLLYQQPLPGVLAPQQRPGPAGRVVPDGK